MQAQVRDLGSARRRGRLRHRDAERRRARRMRASCRRSARSTSSSTTPASCPTTSSRRPSVDEWRRVLAANLDGAFFWSQAVVPAMKARRWGRIVNTSSLAAKTGGLTAGTAYSVSKGALGALTFSLARELAAHGVTANAIAPAYVRTPMVTEQLNEEQRQALLRADPGRPLLRARGVRARRCASSPRRSRASSPARSSISTAAC